MNLKKDKLQFSKTKLLVSFKEFDEIKKVIDYVDILDLKNPLLGSIGPWCKKEIVRVIKEFENRKISATLGDINNPDKTFLQLKKFDELGLDFIKFGFLFKRNSEIDYLLYKIKKRKFKTKIVGVFFAEQKIIGQYILNNLDKLSNSGVNYVLIDTYLKGSSDLLDNLSLDLLSNIINKSLLTNVTIGLAGKVKENQIPTLLKLNPGIIGIRSAACKKNDRNGSISINKLKKISKYFA